MNYLGISESSILTYSGKLSGLLRYISLTSKQSNLAPTRESKLLATSLKVLREPVGIPIFPGYNMRLSSIVMRVRLGSLFWGRTLHMIVV